MTEAAVVGVLLLLLTVALPLVATLSDIVRHRYPRTPPMIALGYLRHLLLIAMPTLVGLVIALLALAIYPAGFIIQLIAGIDLLMSTLAGPDGSLPLTCAWTGIPAGACLPGALALHGTHLVLAILGFRYGERLIDRLGSGLRAGREALEQALGITD